MAGCSIDASPGACPRAARRADPWAKAHPHPELADRTIWQAFEAERPKLVPIRGSFDGFYATQASVSKTCLVRFDNNKYSVTAHAVGRPVEIQAFADAEPLSGFHQADCRLFGSSATVFGQAEAFARLLDADRRPGLAVASLAAHPVERHGDFSIRPVAGEPTQDVDGGRHSIGRVSTGPDARNPHFAMTPAGPVDQQHSLVGRVLELADNLLDEDMDEPLLGTGVG